jgi:glycosyltransferase involved in cell wall biosynthesis
MNFLLVSDAYPPLNVSSSIHIQDLAQALINRNHSVSVITPSPSQKKFLTVSQNGKLKIFRIKTLNHKKNNFIFRFFAEFSMPFLMMIVFSVYKINFPKIHGVIWYSPSIFFGPFIKFLKKKNACRSYLILRDIFPQWLVDIDLISNKSFAFNILKKVELYQYTVANAIGVQSFNNLNYIKKYTSKNQSVEVLNNWLGNLKPQKFPVSVLDTQFKNKIILIYSGNMGLAQDVYKLVQFVKLFENDNRFGFVFVGRGSEFNNIKEIIIKERILNLLLFNEVSPRQLRDLYSECHIGLIALDHRHKSHNIPGKFLSYIQSGLPVIAFINQGNDLMGIIKNNRVGYATSNVDVLDMKKKCLNFMSSIKKNPDVKKRCRKLFNSLYNPQKISKQIEQHFK